MGGDCPQEELTDHLLLRFMQLFSGDIPTFRKELMAAFPVKIFICSDEVPEFLIKIMGEILSGWDWWNPTVRQKISDMSPSPDRKECFLFFCKIYTVMGQNNRKFRERLETLLHKHINSHRQYSGHWEPEWRWKPEDLDEYILMEETPDEIRLILGSARLRIGGGQLVKKEIAALKE